MTERDLLAEATTRVRVLEILVDQLLEGSVEARRMLIDIVPHRPGESAVVAELIDTGYSPTEIVDELRKRESQRTQKEQSAD